jgi:hypothetical protein
MVSEWAKKAECWEAVRRGNYSQVLEGIPELRPASSGAFTTPAKVAFSDGTILPDEISR